MIGEKKKVKLFNGRYKLVTLVTLDAHGVMSRKQPLAGYKSWSKQWTTDKNFDKT